MVPVGQIVTESDDASVAALDDLDLDLDEPRFTYARLGRSTEYIFKKDTLSVLAGGGGGGEGNSLLVGTQSGVVHCLDGKGNEVKRYHLHHAAICDLDLKQGWFGTAGLDGRLSLLGLGGTAGDESYTFDQGRPVRSIALDPQIGKRTVGGGVGLGLNYARAFVSGGMAGQVLMYSKTWTGGHRTTCLNGAPGHSDEGEDDGGPIWSVAWDHGLIMWSNDQALTCYNVATSQIILRLDIGLTAPDAPRPDLVRTHVKWLDQGNTFVVAWASTLRIVERSAAGLQVSRVLETDTLISGLQVVKGDIMLLAFPQDDDASMTGPEPEIRLMTRQGQELSNDGLTVRDFRKHRCSDYWLAGGPDQFYIGSQKEIIVCSSRTVEDRLAWLTEHRHFGQAYKLAVQSKAADDVVAELGRLWIRDLADKGKWPEIIPNLDILKDDSRGWDDLVYRFVENDRLDLLLPHIPTSDPRLSGTVYELVLGRLLQRDREKFIKTVQTWPNDLYSISSVTNAVESFHQRDAKDPVLMDCLAQLYLANDEPQKALGFYLRLKRSKAFDLIEQYNLFDVVRYDIEELLKFNQESRDDRPGGGSKHGPGIDILASNTKSIPVQDVVDQLASKPFYTYQYLDALYIRDPLATQKYHTRMIELYASYEPKALLPLLRSSSSLDLESALRVCRQAQLLEEQVFLLGRMGRYKEALSIIINDLDNVELAIEFAQEMKDAELWHDLLDFAKDKPRYIIPLLEKPDCQPLRLIKLIDPELEIQGLGRGLTNVLATSAQDLKFNEGLERLLLRHRVEIATRILRRQRAGLLVLPESTYCERCREPALSAATQRDASKSLLCAFLCNHLYHARCLDDTIEDSGQPRSKALKIETVARMALAVNSSRRDSASPAKEENVRSLKQIAQNRAMRGKVALGKTVNLQCPVCH